MGLVTILPSDTTVIDVTSRVRANVNSQGLHAHETHLIVRTLGGKPLRDTAVLGLAAQGVRAGDVVCVSRADSALLRGGFVYLDPEWEEKQAQMASLADLRSQGAFRWNMRETRNLPGPDWQRNAIFWVALDEGEEEDRGAGSESTAAAASAAEGDLEAQLQPPPKSFPRDGRECLWLRCFNSGGEGKSTFCDVDLAFGEARLVAVAPCPAVFKTRLDGDDLEEFLDSSTDEDDEPGGKGEEADEPWETVLQKLEEKSGSSPWELDHNSDEDVIGTDSDELQLPRERVPEEEVRRRHRFQRVRVTLDGPVHWRQHRINLNRESPTSPILITVSPLGATTKAARG
jgi:hypothetical protein